MRDLKGIEMTKTQVKSHKKEGVTPPETPQRRMLRHVQPLRFRPSAEETLRVGRLEDEVEAKGVQAQVEGPAEGEAEVEAQLARLEEPAEAEVVAQVAHLGGPVEAEVVAQAARLEEGHRKRLGEVTECKEQGAVANVEEGEDEEEVGHRLLHRSEENSFSSFLSFLPLLSLLASCLSLGFALVLCLVVICGDCILIVPFYRNLAFSVKRI